METSTLPSIDLSDLLQHSQNRSLVIKEIGQACSSIGFFQIINHGVSESVIENVLSSSADFFDLPIEEKMEFMSNDVDKPVRFARGSRDYIKLYSNPLEDWIGSWPNNPPHFREYVGNYANEIRRLGIKLLGAIMESLGLDSTYLNENIERGVHMIFANRYPNCSEHEQVIGIAPHSDHSLITILLQNAPGLEIKDSGNGAWKTVPAAKGTLQVIVGDHLEILSNGLCKSVMHRATACSLDTRLSIAYFFSLGMEEVIEPAMELVDEEHPQGYKGSSLRDFIRYLTSNQAFSYIDSLKI